MYCLYTENNQKLIFTHSPRLKICTKTDENGSRTRELGFASHNKELLERTVRLVDTDATLQIEPNPAANHLPQEQLAGFLGMSKEFEVQY